ncbi:MAG: MerC domain-containing protein [Sphingobacteriaceae bacterium]|nr:MerC domain-containing protein [Sphingobacteriaceae bacterium]
MNPTKINKADLIGILSSSICLVHCLATPLLIAFGAEFITNPFFKYLFLILSFASIFKATEKVTNIKNATLLWVSFWGFLFSTLFQETYEWLHYSGYLFAILIIIGHILNIKYCRECLTQNENEN